MTTDAEVPAMIPPIASRFVAAETATGAMDRVRALNERDVGAILNRLGEHHRDPDPVEADVTAYRELVVAIGETPCRACVSVKPTQLGLSIDEATFRENLERIVTAAREAGVFVWIDMEAPDTIDATLAGFEAVAGPDVGICLQANLRRTRADLERLAGGSGRVRLVKGAYDPPAAEAYDDRAAVDAAYRELLAEAFQSVADGVAVATHDRAMVNRAIELHETHGTPFEVQMLMGVREELQFELAAAHDVWQYVPYGRRWLTYFVRRVAERRENLAFAIRALMR